MEQVINYDVRIVNNFHTKKKIKQNGKEDDNHLYFSLSTFSYSLGITNTPKPEDIKSIILFLKRQYFHLTNDDFTYAFELYLINKLDCKIIHTNMFSVKYVADVVNAFLKYRGEELSSFNKQPPLPTEKQIEGPTKEQQEENLYNGLLKYVEENKTTTQPIPKFWSWSMVFNHMHRAKMVELTPEQIKKLEAQATSQLRKEQEDEAAERKKRMEKLQVNTAIPETDVKTRMRKIYIIQYLTKKFNLS